MNIVLKGRVPSKKNGKQIALVKSKRIIIESDQHRAWFSEQWYDVKSQKNALAKTGAKFPLTKINGVHFTLFAPDARKGDLSNKFESVADLLVSCGIITDDNWCVLPLVIMSFGGIDRKNPRAEVLLTI